MAERSSDTAAPDAGAPIPGSVMTEKHVRMLKIAIGIMSALLVVGFFVLAVKLVDIATNLGDGSGSVPAGGDAEAIASIRQAYGTGDGVIYAEGRVIAGARVEASTIAGDELILTLRDRGGLSLYRINVKDWRVTAVMRLTPDGDAASR